MQPGRGGDERASMWGENPEVDVTHDGGGYATMKTQSVLAVCDTSNSSNQLAADRNNIYRIGTFFFGLAWLALLLFAAPPAHASQQNPDWSLPEFQRATEAYRSRDCGLAWDLMWPLAKAGKYEARYFLAATTAAGLIPPGNAVTSRTRFTQHVLTFTAYSVAGPKGPKPFQGDPNFRWARTEIPRMITELNLGAKGERVARCYRSSSSFQTCLNLAIELGVVPHFDRYASELDAEQRQTGIKASCVPRPF